MMMGTMKTRIMLHVLICVLCALGKEVLAILQVEGTEGQNLTFTCTHSWASTNIKYLCRWNCNDNEVLIRSEGVGRVAQRGRYSLYDRGVGRFTVTIAELRKRDAGTYWCGVERSGMDSFDKVFIKVLDAPQVTKAPQTPLPENMNTISTKDRWNYIPVGVFAVLVILVVSLMLHHHWENISSALRACPLATRGQTNPVQVETSPGEQNPEKRSSVYENMYPSVSN